MLEGTRSILAEPSQEGPMQGALGWTEPKAAGEKPVGDRDGAAWLLL